MEFELKGKKCIVCGATYDLHMHEIYGGSNRQASIKYKMQVRLCGKHHNLSDEGIHFNPRLAFEVKQLGQAEFEKEYLHIDFLKTFGMDYLAITFKEYMRGRW